MADNDNIRELRHPTRDDPFGKFNAPSSPILFPVAERAVAWQNRSGSWTPTAGHKAIIRVDPNNANTARLLNVVGHSYKLVHNRELLTHVEDTMRDKFSTSDLSGVSIQDKVAYFGRVCSREYIFPGIKCLVQSYNARSEIAFRIIVQNGYGGSALRIHAGAIDFYCSNGMIRGEFTTTYRKHTSRLVIDNLTDTLDNAIEGFVLAQPKWHAWAAKRVKHEDAMNLFRSIANSPRLYDNLGRQYLREQEARGPNLWAVYSTLTYYASHNDGEFALRKSVEDVNSEAHIMLKRELSVSKWVQTKEWLMMEDA
jgi:hypothetical protein